MNTLGLLYTLHPLFFNATKIARWDRDPRTKSVPGPKKFEISRTGPGPRTF